MGFFRKPEIGTGALPSSVVSEFESNLIGVVEPLVGGGDFLNLVCFHADLISLTQSSGKLRNQEEGRHNWRHQMFIAIRAHPDF